MASPKLLLRDLDVGNPGQGLVLGIWFLFMTLVGMEKWCVVLCKGGSLWVNCVIDRGGRVCVCVQNKREGKVWGTRELTGNQRCSRKRERDLTSSGYLLHWETIQFVGVRLGIEFFGRILQMNQWENRHFISFLVEDVILLLPKRD